MRALVCVFLTSAVLLPGCASSVTAWKNDPLQSYDIRGPSVYAMTGDRRTAVLMRKGNGQRFCAESLPDAVAAYSAASEASAEVAERGKAGFKDATYAGLLQTFQRTEIAEVYRQMGWNICLAWAQEAISDAEYSVLLNRYVWGGLEAIKSRASQPQTWPTVAHGSLLVVPGTAPSAKPESSDEKPPAAPTPPADGSIPLADGVKLQPLATASSGFCIKAPAGYVGAGTIMKPNVSEALPLCAGT